MRTIRELRDEYLDFPHRRVLESINPLRQAQSMRPSKHQCKWLARGIGPALPEWVHRMQVQLKWPGSSGDAEDMAYERDEGLVVERFEKAHKLQGSTFKKVVLA